VSKIEIVWEWIEGEKEDFVIVGKTESIRAEKNREESREVQGRKRLASKKYRVNDQTYRTARKGNI
jgi:hypothetical protein